MSPVCTGVCTRVCPVYVPVPIFGFYRKNPYIRDIYENVRIMSAKLIGFTAFALLSGGGIVLFMRR